MKDRIIFITEVVLVICIIAFVAVYFIQSGEYNRSQQEYDSLSDYVKEPAETLDERLSREGIPAMEIDFEALKAQNEDFVGWLYMPGLDISYPVVQGEDDEFYLHHTFEGTENSSGCIFLESKSSAELDEYNSFLFGHNMKNGTMFGSLKRLINEEGLYESAGRFYLYTPDAFRKYTVYSYYITSPGSDIYYLNENEEEYAAWQEKALADDAGSCGVEVDTTRPTLTLSTCSGAGADKQRLVVHGILDAMIERQ